MVGNEVFLLFPNIQSRSTGKIIREEVETSPITIEGYKYQLGTQYIVMNKQYTRNLAPIANLLPWRSKPRAKTKPKEKKQIQARVVKIGTRFLFQILTYKFGGKTYLQMSGGPIRARVTMSAAHLVMQSWARQYSGVLLRDEVCEM